jgi:glycosyltransferase involved in cell wall biosynthesis
MRILHINKFGSVKGGSEVYLQTVATAQAAADLEVGVFAGAPVEPLVGVRAFPVVVPDFHQVGGFGKVSAALNVVWSKGARLELARVLDEFRPDVAHLHLYAHQFSSSIIALLRERRVPTVMTAHDFQLVCPAYLAVRKGKDCLDCANRISAASIRDRCLQGSLAWTATAVAENMLVRKRSLLPDILLGPSQYMVDALSHSWVGNRTSIALLRNPAVPSGGIWHGEGGYILYVGRLSAEKGVDRLLLWCAALGIRLVVAGAGSERLRLEALANEARTDVEFTGHVDPNTLRSLRMGCRAQVVPSTWPENAPLAALEAAVDGVPLLVSARGGLPEIIELGARGAIITEDSEQAFSAALTYLKRQQADLAKVRAKLDLAVHLTSLLDAYGKLAGAV